MKRQICLTASILLLSAAVLPGRAQSPAPQRGETAAPVTANLRSRAEKNAAAPALAKATLPKQKDEVLYTKNQEAFALLKDGSFAVGIFRKAGNTYVFTTSCGKQTVKIADVISLEFLTDVHVPYHAD